MRSARMKKTRMTVKALTFQSRAMNHSHKVHLLAGVKEEFGGGILGQFTLSYLACPDQ